MVKRKLTKWCDRSGIARCHTKAVLYVELCKKEPMAGEVRQLAHHYGKVILHFRSIQIVWTAEVIASKERDHQIISMRPGAARIQVVFFKH